LFYHRHKKILSLAARIPPPERPSERVNAGLSGCHYTLLDAAAPELLLIVVNLVRATHLDDDSVRAAIPKCVDAGPSGTDPPYSTLPLRRSSSLLPI
jgi:hypothetical protein